MKPAVETKQASVEERRGAYEALAESLITMTRLETQSRGKSPLQVADELDEQQDKPRLIDAVLAHFTALAHNLDWYDPRTIRKFYVELRLHDDELRAERQRAYEGARTAAAGQKGGAK